MTEGHERVASPRAQTHNCRRALSARGAQNEHKKTLIAVITAMLVTATPPCFGKEKVVTRQKAKVRGVERDALKNQETRQQQEIYRGIGNEKQ